MSGRLAGLLDTVAKRQDALDFSCAVSLNQSHVSLSNLHSPMRTNAPEGVAVKTYSVIFSSLTSYKKYLHKYSCNFTLTSFMIMQEQL